jgi:hypothetical protein
MSLRTAVAAPFRTEGVERLEESEFVVALSLDRGWFSPDQAKRLIDVAATEGLLQREDDGLVVTFEPGAVDVPADFAPDEDVLRERSTFERLLDALTDAGIEKRTAVAEVNQLQAALGVTVEVAAVVYARREGVSVEDVADDVRREL